MWYPLLTVRVLLNTYTHAQNTDDPWLIHVAPTHVYRRSKLVTDFFKPADFLGKQITTLLLLDSQRQNTEN